MRDKEAKAAGKGQTCCTVPPATRYIHSPCAVTQTWSACVCVCGRQKNREIVGLKEVFVHIGCSGFLCVQLCNNGKCARVRVLQSRQGVSPD